MRVRARGRRDGRRSRSASCGGCSTAASGSRATRCTCSCSTRRTSSATRARSRWRPTTARWWSAASRSRRPATRIIELLGGRAIHPVSPRLGGFYKAPRPKELRALLPALEEGLEDALEAVRWTAGLDFPDYEQDYVFVALERRRRLPARERRPRGGVGPRRRPARRLGRRASRRPRSPHSNALQARLGTAARRTCAGRWRGCTTTRRSSTPRRRRR